MNVQGKSAIALVVAAFLTFVPSGQAASLQPVGGFDSPVFVTSDPADEDRLFVVEQGGRIKLREGGQTTTFLDLTTITPPIVAAGGEQGLLSMAFAPDYPTTGRFYVFYTGTDGGALHVEELTASGDSADPATRSPVITISHPTFTNHNGGQLQFGADGYLYISTGDGGGGGDPGENAQNLSSLLGKILRIAPIPGGGYAVPSDNPFAGSTPGADEIWSYGLRNPWRFSFDRMTGDLVIGDVGQGLWEEIDFDPIGLGAGRGDNFGWDCYEGRHDFELTGCPPIASTTQPVFEYPNPPSGPASVTGGYVVRDPGLDELYGRYVYADAYAGDIRSLRLEVPDAADDRSEGLAVANPVSFGEDACGRIYVASLLGDVYRIVDGTATDCTSSTPTPPPPPGAANPPEADSSGPGLSIEGKKKRRLGRGRRLSVFAIAAESGVATIAAHVIAGHGKIVFELEDQGAQLEANIPQAIRWRLRNRQLRRVRDLIAAGRPVRVVFEGTATDAAGNRGPAAEFEVRLLPRD